MKMATGAQPRLRTSARGRRLTCQPRRAAKRIISSHRVSGGWDPGCAPGPRPRRRLRARLSATSGLASQASSYRPMGRSRGSPLNRTSRHELVGSRCG